MPNDVQQNHIIFAFTPPRAHPYIRLMRLDRPIGTWLLLFSCWWGLILAHQSVFSMGMKGWLHALLFAAGALVMRSAGCVVNDLWDRNLDRNVERTKARPLAAGEITVKQAGLLLAALLFAGLLILLSFRSLFALGLGAASLLLVAAYPLMKRVTWWPQLFLGFTFNWGALMGFAVTDGKLGLPALLLYAGGICWTLAYDTVYAHQDIEDDATAGIKSTARLFGERSKRYVGYFLAAAIILFIAAKFMAAPSFMTPLLSLPVIVQAVWQMKRWDPASPQSCLAAFRSNAAFGWLVLLMMSV